MLLLGVTVAMGSVYILDAALTIGGTATVGSTCVCVPARTGCMTAGAMFLTAMLPSPMCSKACDGAVE